MKCTPEDHCDYENTTQALENIKKDVNDMNSTIERNENLHEMLKIQESFVDQLVLIEPGRSFIREGQATLINNQNRANRQLFLFNDMLIIAKRGLLQQSYQQEEKIVLVSAGIATSSFHVCGIEISFGVRTIILLWKSNTEKEVWLEDLINLKNNEILGHVESLNSKTPKIARQQSSAKLSRTDSRRSSF